MQLDYRKSSNGANHHSIQLLLSSDSLPAVRRSALTESHLATCLQIGHILSI